MAASQVGREMLREGIRDFLLTESPPDLVRRQDEGKSPPLELLRQLGSLGYLGVGMPEKWGGSGDMVDVTIMMEELGRYNQGLAHLVGRTMYGLQLLVTVGTTEQQEMWIPRLLSGECVLAIGMTEPNAGSDAAAIQTRAVLEGDAWRVNGTKVFTSSAAYADVVLLAARTGSTSERHSGVTTFLADARSEGIQTSLIDTIGYWSVGVYEVRWTDVLVPVKSVLGDVGDGWRVLRGHLVRERLTIAARAVGAMTEILELAVKYAKEREQFGSAIASFQAVQHKLADIRIDLQIARSALYNLADQVVAGQADPTDAAVVKTFASEAWVRCADRGMQIFGGYGYTYEFPIQRHFRDSRVALVGGGTSEIMRNMIARRLIRSA
ncbi:MAG TPA: acyl-CoA dehydrogenase family protein [Streptosporangiaceae bacterium]